MGQWRGLSLATSKKKATKQCNGVADPQPPAPSHALRNPSAASYNATVDNVRDYCALQVQGWIVTQLSGVRVFRKEWRSSP